VLGLLLVGKERKQVQRELAQLQLIPKLSNLFDRLEDKQKFWHNKFFKNQQFLVGDQIRI